MQVRGLVAHAGEQLELQREQVRLADVPVAAPVADHRVLLDRFERLATFQAAELVGAEVDRAVDDRPGAKARRDAQQRRRHAVEELVPATPCQELSWMHAAERVGQHELGAQQADAVDWLGSHLLGVVRHRQVDVDARGQRSDALGAGSRRHDSGR